MPAESNQLSSLLIINPSFIFKIGFLLFAGLYFIFTLIVIRQVTLMTETVQTQAAPILKLVSILYALFALGVVIFFFLVI